MRFEREQLLDLDAALGRTWIHTDGAGALAAGTPLFCPASRAHGLLTAPVPGSPALHLLLARLEDWIVEGERALPLASARYPGAFHPGGHTFLASFDDWPRPTWTYRLGDVEVVRELLLVPEPVRGHTLLVRYRVTAPPGPARRLRLIPLVAFRESGALTFENVYAERRAEPIEAGCVVQPYPSLPALSLTLGGAPARFTAEPAWYRRVEYAADRAAGLPAHEDHLAPGVLEAELQASGTVVLAATTGPAVEDPCGLWERTAGGGRRARPRPRAPRAAARALPAAPDSAQLLARAAASHLVRGPAGVRVAALRPWGADDPAAALRALPGLLLPSGRVRDLGDALRAHVPELAAATDPGRSTDELGRARAAALAWTRGVERLARAPGRRPADVRELEAEAFTLGAALRRAAQGDPEAGGDGLLSGSPDPGPRRLCVALNARWAGFAAWLAARARARAGRGPGRRGWPRVAELLAAACAHRFVTEGAPTPASSWQDGAADPAFRPEVVRAAAEPASPFPLALRQRVLARARRELVTPRGLRTLSPADPAYSAWAGPRAPGPRAPRQGRVELAEAGDYVALALALEGRRPALRAALRAWVQGLDGALAEHGLGTLPEAFDGDAPHPAGGAPSSALALAGVLEARAALGLGVA